MKTVADDLRDKAIEHTNQAIKCLGEIVVNEAEGADDYKEAYAEKLREAMNKLIDVRALLR